MNHKSIRILSIMLILTAFGLIPGAIAAGPKKVAILPFNMNADRDLTFLQEGIMDMLASRLAWKGEVDILEKGLVKKRTAQFKESVDKEKALLIGKALAADYVITGSLTVFGESVSIDAVILDIARGEALVTAFNQSRGLDEVIPTVNGFAEDINEKIMGRVMKVPPAYAGAREASKKGPGGLISPMEKLGDTAPAYVQKFGVQILGMDVGDVDGDGKNDLVFIDNDTVYVYKWTNRSFAQFQAVKGRRSSSYYYVSVGDMDGNGRVEIYVSNVMSAGIGSLVLEWSGSGFREIANGQKWFFRVIDVPGRGKALIGQQREHSGSYLGGVQFLTRQGGDFVPAGLVTGNDLANVFNFAFIDLDGNRQTVLFNPSEHLRLYDSGGERIWQSDEQFGGTYVYMDSGEPDIGLMDQNRYYVSSPIYVTDVDKDGTQEIMVCQNHSDVRGLLGRLRTYSAGTLYFFTLDKVGLTEKWRTQKQPGPIAGYSVTDLDGDGTQELLIASVTKQDFEFSKPQSQVVVYDLK